MEVELEHETGDLFAGWCGVRCITVICPSVRLVLEDKWKKQTLDVVTGAVFQEFHPLVLP
jgi:hypothetical protein